MSQSKPSVKESIKELIQKSGLTKLFDFINSEEKLDEIYLRKDGKHPEGLGKDEEYPEGLEQDKREIEDKDEFFRMLSWREQEERTLTPQDLI